MIIGKFDQIEKLNEHKTHKLILKVKKKIKK